LYNNFFTNVTNTNRLEDGISVTPDIIATCVALMSGVLHRSSTLVAMMSVVFMANLWARRATPVNMARYH
jgi:hypothetical protein